MKTNTIQSHIRKDFPIYSHTPNLVYLDTAATALKPSCVIDSMNEYYMQYSANIKRGVYSMSARATEEYERARASVARLIGAPSAEVIFTRNTTEGINLVMYSLGTQIIKPGDEIVTTVMEHHSNFVPWQQLAISQGATLKVVDVTDSGELDLGAEYSKPSLARIVTKKTKILALAHVSNVLGTINPLASIIQEARHINPNIIIVVDGAQAVAHIPVDVVDLDCDFYAFSAHKMYGPTGIGALWGRADILQQMSPFQYGGDMIESVTLAKTTFAQIPEKFEAGTPAIAEAIGMGRAAEYVMSLDHRSLRLHTKNLVEKFTSMAAEMLGDRCVIHSNTNIEHNIGIVTFAIEGIHPHDVASYLDGKNICVRAGHHCAMPLHERFGSIATTRASFGAYTTIEDIEALVSSLGGVVQLFTK